MPCVLLGNSAYGKNDPQLVNGSGLGEITSPCWGWLWMSQGGVSDISGPSLLWGPWNPGLWSCCKSACDQCMIRNVISAWSATWPMHDQPRDQCLQTWAIFILSKTILLSRPHFPQLENGQVIVDEWLSVRDGHARCIQMQKHTTCMLIKVISVSIAIHSGRYSRSQAHTTHRQSHTDTYTYRQSHMHTHK